ncbi:hypothetical protein JKP88DRAFT_169526 [Tribonema minus]|uniref:Transposase n=1 Tax=Tribonema minus TaxID=303371 RepID=A0A835YMJ3_9STRA|nr:hypothetical protein JKP88DRAFT_169526 [Tribonema minus]
MRAAAALRDADAKGAYDAFLEDAASCHPEQLLQQLALPWATRAHGSHLSVSSDDVLRRVFNAAFSRIKPYLLADLVRRDPGCCISGDGTFKIAGRVTSSATVLHFILGADHCVVAFAAVKGDGFTPVIPLYMQLRRRLEAMGKLFDVQAVYSDRCCEQRNDPSTAPQAVIFPGCRRVWGDGWHAINTLIEATTRSNHPDLQAFAAAVGKAIRVPHQEDVEALKRLFIDQARQQGQMLHPDVAELRALNRGYAESVRTVGPPGSVIAANLRRVFAKFDKNDGERPDSKAPPERLYRPSGRDKSQRSTEEVFENTIRCADKGCLTDPLPFPRMHTLLRVMPKTKRPIYRSVGQTVKNEALHSKVNKLVDGISKVGADSMNSRLLLRVFAHNRQRDVEWGRCSAHEPCPWITARALCPGAEPPPEPQERMGWDYYRDLCNQQLKDLQDMYDELKHANSKGIESMHMVVRSMVLRKMQAKPV